MAKALATQKVGGAREGSFPRGGGRLGWGRLARATELPPIVNRIGIHKPLRPLNAHMPHATRAPQVRNFVVLGSPCPPVVPPFKPIVDAREASGPALLRMHLSCLRIWAP